MLFLFVKHGFLCILAILNLGMALFKLIIGFGGLGEWSDLESILVLASLKSSNCV